MKGLGILQVVWALALSVTTVSGRKVPLASWPKVPKPSQPGIEPVTSRNGTVLPPYNTTYFFNQLIDHNNPTLGTFQQRYWTTWEFYEPSGPIVLFTPGEDNADGYEGYLTNRTINGQIAQQQNGATIVIEHRFYGESNPQPDLTVQSLRLLTIQQAIDDLEYFAKNVVLPMPGGGNVAPGKANWVMVGGSYSGALTSWTMVNKPGLFTAGYASSAVVEAIVDYWGYFTPIQNYMPKNCSADVSAVIQHVDQVFTSGNQTAIQGLKTVFGLQSMNHLDDVAGALRNNLWTWQDLQPESGPGQLFYEFCDALEVKNGVNAPTSGWGLSYALQAWGNYWNTTFYALVCGDQDPVDCLGTYDPTQSYFTDTSVDNSGRSWEWTVCTELGFFQEGPPPQDPPGIVTKLVQPGYDMRQCTYFFPEAFPNGPQVPTANSTNGVYDGWRVDIERLFFANGLRDPWREATVSADGLGTPSRPLQPIAVSDAFHCSDLLVANGAVDSTVLAVQRQGLSAMRSWLS